MANLPHPEALSAAGGERHRCWWPPDRRHCGWQVGSIRRRQRIGRTSDGKRPGILQWTKVNCSRSSRWAGKRTTDGRKRPERPKRTPKTLSAPPKRTSAVAVAAAVSADANGPDGGAAKIAASPATNWPTADVRIRTKRAERRR